MKATSALAGATWSDPMIAGATWSDRLIGAIVGGRYQIEESIGAGQMARVYRARHVRLSRSFALKVLSGVHATDPVMRLRFAQEADIASSLDHPNVVSVVDFGRSESGELYLVMDLIEGESLAQVIAREGPFAPARAIALTRALARGLGHAHERGLVHRDFKPDNVVLERIASGELLPRILDFGLAIRADPDDGEPRLTEQGFVVGTPLYLAPEQACAEPVDARADLYALGVVLYEMLAGRPPFEGNAIEVARRKLVEPPPPIARRNPAVATPPALEAVARRLLAQYPDDRFQTAADLVAALDGVEATHPSRPRLPARAEPLPPSRVEPDPPRRRWHRLVIAAAALAAIVAGGVSSGADTRSADPAGTAPAATRAVPRPTPHVVSPAPATAIAREPSAAALLPPAVATAPARRPLARPAPATTNATITATNDERARLAREYREIGEALDRLHTSRGAAAAAPLEARYLDLSFADSLRLPALRREALARLAALRRAIRAAERPLDPASP